MRFVLGRITVVAAITTASVACSSAGETSAESPEDGGPTTSTVTETVTPPAPTETSSTANLPSIPGSATVRPDAVSVEPRSLPEPKTVVRLTRVTTEADDDGERIVFEAEGDTLPGLQVRYVDIVRVEGEPVLVDGSAFLEVMLTQADPNAEQGLSPDVAVELVPDQPLVHEVRYARYLDGVVTFAVGLAEEANFRVVTADEPSRIIVEFAPRA